LNGFVEALFEFMARLPFQLALSERRIESRNAGRAQAIGTNEMRLFRFAQFLHNQFHKIDIRDLIAAAKL